MITFSLVTPLPPLSTRWWKVLGAELRRTLRYRNPRTIGIRRLSLKEMRQYNKRYRGKDRPTDVLSFEASAEMKRDDPGYLGDLLLCVEYAAHEAHRRGISLEEELARLVIHGVLHLVGYDHATVRDESVMFGLQEACLDRVLLCVNHS